MDLIEGDLHQLGRLAGDLGQAILHAQRRDLLERAFRNHDGAFDQGAGRRPVQDHIPAAQYVPGLLDELGILGRCLEGRTEDVQKRLRRAGRDREILVDGARAGPRPVGVPFDSLGLVVAHKLLESGDLGHIGAINLRRQGHRSLVFDETLDDLGGSRAEHVDLAAAIGQIEGIGIGIAEDEFEIPSHVLHPENRHRVLRAIGVHGTHGHRLGLRVPQTGERRFANQQDRRPALDRSDETPLGRIVAHRFGMARHGTKTAAAGEDADGQAVGPHPVVEVIGADHLQRLVADEDVRISGDMSRPVPGHEPAHSVGAATRPGRHHDGERLALVIVCLGRPGVRVGNDAERADEYGRQDEARDHPARMNTFMID